MGVVINGWAVVLAAISSMVVGALWYMPATFGKSWMKMTGVKPDKMKGVKAPYVLWTYGSVFVASLFTAYVLAHITFLASRYFQNSYLFDAISTGFWLWLGFTATRLYVHDTFENRRKKLTAINAMHELATIMVMALIIGTLK